MKELFSVLTHTFMERRLVYVEPSKRTRSMLVGTF